MTLKLAFSRPTDTLEEQRILFENYRQIGYDGLQLKNGQYASYLECPEQFLEDWGAPKGLASGLITAGVLDEQNIQQLRNVYKFAEKTGTDLIVFCHLVPRSEVSIEEIRKYADLFSELGKEAEQCGVKLSLHHHYNNPVMHREDFDIFFDRIQNQSVGLTVDTAHLVKSGITDIQELIQSYGKVIDNFHLKDFANGDWRVLGQGEIDFKPIFKAIEAIKYNGWISADEESGSGIIGGMKDCHSYIKQGLSIAID
ncbi:sugar phosphate isomerase/epimerase family protein [Litchfieldia alkalitelluris]|uniref:sugar phosphate isomerase/epimerase family protein n=1 Tax=Litchfieldia alkalitelluris TaxID=304268 RepID=UPI000997B54B|nr:sugar phosphate isomerase/epimerase [Litchfieldia alkalitelluris]